MTVHVVIPVFNRLAMTQDLIACLRAQRIDIGMRLLVVNDGSSDGTAEWLAEQGDIDVLDGDGSLFWGGAVDLAFRDLERSAQVDDWVLLMNNDTKVDPDFVSHLMTVAAAHAPAAVGSVIRDERDPQRLLSVGGKVDAWKFLTSDVIDASSQSDATEPIEVDVLSGRGVLFPWAGLLAAGGMRAYLLPHYFADYELSLRVRRKGWRLLIAPQAAVLSDDDYGSARRLPTWRQKFFSSRSPLYIPALMKFWWEASNWPQRMTLPFRLPAFALFPGLRKRTKR